MSWDCQTTEVTLTLSILSQINFIVLYLMNGIYSPYFLIKFVHEKKLWLQLSQRPTHGDQNFWSFDLEDFTADSTHMSPDFFYAQHILTTVKVTL